MSDDQLPDRAELASAYLDGELEADERAAVEGDAQAMAMVDSFGRIRSELSTFDPVDDSVRSAAMAAALAEFDARADATVPAAAAAVVTPLPSRRHRGYRVLTGVAAAVVIAVVGIAALNSTKGNDENSSAGVAPAATATPPQLKIASDTAASAAPTAANNAAGAVSAGTAAPADATSIESAVTTLPEINSKAELQAFASSFRTVTAAPTAAATATTAAAAATTGALGDNSFQSPCVTPEQTELGQVLYRGTAAVVVRDNASGEVKAIGVAGCTVLETAP